MREYPSADAVRFAPRTSCIFIRSYTTSPVTVAPATGLRFYLIRQSAAKKQAKKHHHKQDNDHSPHTASPLFRYALRHGALGAKRAKKALPRIPRTSTLGQEILSGVGGGEDGSRCP